MNKRTLLLVLLILFSLDCKAEKDEATKDVTELDVADLLKVEVTSVSKKAQALSDAPSAIFVISNEDIRRSGATSLPEALRMAPGIDVARINSNKWAVSARGFNGGFSNKLLVLVDGRSIYTPVFSGVYWDSQDVMLEDVERIEVIRGPGATLWGANAVNGVINVITKKTENTQGGLLTAGGGSQEIGFGSFRYGKKLGEETFARAYVKGFKRGEFTDSNPVNAGDDWDKKQAGFRLDSILTKQDELSFNGNLYQQRFGQAILEPVFAPPFSKRLDNQWETWGWNFTSKLKHTHSATSESIVQFYYDHYYRADPYTTQQLDSLDIDFQNNFQLFDDHHVIWGMGYRANIDSFQLAELNGNLPSTLVKIDPSHRNTQLFSAFIQDEVSLIDDKLWLTIGSKFEHNDYTGFEGQPTVKLMWAPTTRQRVWGSISRAVRTPSRAENDIQLTTGIYPFGGAVLPLQINGNRNFKAEELIAYELGYRFSWSNKFSIDLTAFYNDYQSVRSANFANITPVGITANFNNSSQATTFGFESSAVWQMTDWWRWDANYSFLNSDINIGPNDLSIIGTSPSHKVSLRAELIPVKNVNLDFWLRYTSNAHPVNARTLASESVHEFVTLDARIGWMVHPSVELSVVGQNLLDNHHQEFIEETFILPTEIPRSVYGKISVEF